MSKILCIVNIVTSILIRGGNKSINIVVHGIIFTQLHTGILTLYCNFAEEEGLGFGSFESWRKIKMFGSLICPLLRSTIFETGTGCSPFTSFTHRLPLHSSRGALMKAKKLPFPESVVKKKFTDFFCDDKTISGFFLLLFIMFVKFKY